MYILIQKIIGKNSTSTTMLGQFESKQNAIDNIREYANRAIHDINPAFKTKDDWFGDFYIFQKDEFRLQIWPDGVFVKQANKNYRIAMIYFNAIIHCLEYNLKKHPRLPKTQDFTLAFEKQSIIQEQATQMQALCNTTKVKPTVIHQNDKTIIITPAIEAEWSMYELDLRDKQG